MDIPKHHCHDDDKQVGLSDQEVKAKLYELEQRLPDLALDLEHLMLRLGHLPQLRISGSHSGMLTYSLDHREIAHLNAEGTFDIRVPPQLRDAIVEIGWGEHHRREYDGCWISHHLTQSEDIEEFVRLICLAHAYVICVKEPAPLEEAQTEAAHLCEVTRTLESRAELKDLALPSTIFKALLTAVESTRTHEFSPEGPSHA